MSKRRRLCTTKRFESMTSGEIDAAAAAAAEKAGSEAYDNFKPTTTLGKTTGKLSAKDEAARDAAFNTAYEDALASNQKGLVRRHGLRQRRQRSNRGQTPCSRGDRCGSHGKS